MSHYDDSSTVHVATAQCCDKATSPPMDGSGKEICQHFSLKHFPYIIYGTNGKMKEEYNGKRTNAAMIQFIDSNSEDLDAADEDSSEVAEHCEFKVAGLTTQV